MNKSQEERHIYKRTKDHLNQYKELKIILKAIIIKINSKMIKLKI